MTNERKTSTLNDMTIVLASVDYDDEGNAYTVTQILRADFEGNALDVKEMLNTNTHVVDWHMVGYNHNNKGEAL